MSSRLRRTCIVAEGARVAFVSVGAVGLPGNLTLWVKTDLCVAFVACPACGAKRGELCKSARQNGRTSSATHYKRRAVFSKNRLV